MADLPEEKPSLAPDAQDQRLHRLSGHTREHRAYNIKYSTFIRRLRIVLPLMALSIIAVLFSWNMLQEEKIAPKAPDPQSASQVKNELVNPRFDSVDQKNQPYSITAARALQDERDSKIILLERPLADLTLNNGHWIAIKSKQGTYRQDQQTLALREDVNLFHDLGYTLTTAALDVDLAKETADTQTEILGRGPRGELSARGLKADAKAGTLIFTGPAKLVLFPAKNADKTNETKERATP